jgi:DNA-binding NarL/FixJ family response regulator
LAVSHRVAAHPRLVDTIRSVATEITPLEEARSQHRNLDAHFVALSEDAGPVSGEIGIRITVGDIGEATVRNSMRANDGALISPEISVDDLRTILMAATDGYYPLPQHLAPTIASRLDSTQPLMLSPRDITILRHLASGGTMIDLGQRLGCSERQARRYARTLWNAMDVKNRAEGLVTAARRGLLDIPETV